MLKRNTMMMPPKGIIDDDPMSDDSDDDRDALSPIVDLGSKPKMQRQDTFYDQNYEGVKISTMPKTNEGWIFFMDMLKTEHRKFKLLLTNLRIERGKIIKEFESFTAMFQEAKVHVQSQFLTCMKDLKAVNIARLLNGEINKRSSSFIKSPTVKPKSMKGSPVTIRNALESVQENFRDSFTMGFESGPSEKMNGSMGSMAIDSFKAPQEHVPISLQISSRIEVSF
jgi:hypothetical protein